MEWECACLYLCGHVLFFWTLLILKLFDVLYSYIARTLYGEEEEEDATPKNKSVEEPKLLGLHPVSNEKVCFI